MKSLAYKRAKLNCFAIITATLLLLASLSGSLVFGTGKVQAEDVNSVRLQATALITPIPSIAITAVPTTSHPIPNNDIDRPIFEPAPPTPSFFDYIREAAPDIIINLITSVIFVSLTLVLLAFPSTLVRVTKIFRLWVKVEPAKIESYSEKLTRLTESLTKASSEVDNLLTELAEVASDRATSVQKLEADLTNLEEQEKQLKKRITDLENVPLPVAEHFAKLTEPGERRSARRDYILFVSGIAVGQAVSILFRIFGLG